jgi:hypothetical protein
MKKARFGFMNKMKRVAALVCLLALSASAWASGGYIHDASGSVSLAVGKDAPRWAKINDTVTTGTVIRTGKASHAVLKFEDGQVVSLQADTTFQVRKYIFTPQQPQDSNILFSMFKGGMRFVTGMIGKQNPDAFRLATPHTTIGIRGTDFMTAMSNKGIYNQVISGSISSTNAAGTFVLGAGQTSLTTSATAAATTIPAASVPAGTFTQIGAIPLPPAAPAAIPAPPAAGAGTPLTGVAPSTAASGTATTATTAAAGTTATKAVAAGTTAGTTATATAGGAAAGGAGVAAVTTAGAGISATTIAIGVGVAAGVAAIVNATTTTHH